MSRQTLEPRTGGVNDESGQLIGRSAVKAEPGHAGIEAQVIGQVAFASPSLLFPRFELCRRVEHGCESLGLHFRFLPLGGAGQKEDLLLDPGLSQHDGFVKIRHREAVGASRGERPGDFHGSVAVSVTLDHRHDGHPGTHRSTDLAIVLGQPFPTDTGVRPHGVNLRI